MRSRRLRSIVLAGCALAGFAANSSAQFVASWTSATSGTWTNAANWSTNPVFPNNNSPGVGDTYDAVINAVGPAYTVTLDSAVTLNSLHINSPSVTFAHSAGTLSLANGGTLSGGLWQFSGGTLAGPGSLNIDGGAFSVVGASARRIQTTVNNRSLIQVNGGSATLNDGTINNLAGGVLYLNGASIAPGAGTNNLLSNAGTIYGIAGSISLPLNNSGTLESITSFTINAAAHSHSSGARLSGLGFFNLVGGTHTLNGQLDIDALTNVTGAAFDGVGTLNLSGTMNWNSGTIAGAGVLNIAPSGKFNLPLGNARLLSRSINNQGEMHVSGGTTGLSGPANINNSGLMRVSVSSPIAGSASSSLINSGTLLFDANATASFSGLSIVNSGTILSNGQGVTLPSNVTHNGNSYIGGSSTISLTGTQTINGTLTLGPSGVSLNSSVNGPGTLLVTGASTWNGTMSGTGVTDVAPGATLTASGLLFRSLSNSGTIRVPSSGPSSTLTLQSGTLNNLAGGVMVIAGGLSSGGGQINNFGTVIFSNTNGGAATVFSANSGTILAHRPITLGSVVHNPGAYLAGTSPITFFLPSTQLVLGTLTIDGAVVSNGTLTGAGAIDVFGSFNATSGNVQGPGAINVKPGGTLTVGSLSWSRVVNNAAVTSLDAANFSSTATFTNAAGGVMYLGDASITSTSYNLPIRNDGTLIANARSDRSIFLNGSGSHTLFNTGTLLVPAGSLNLRATLQGGSHIAGDGRTNFTSIFHEGDFTLAGSNTILNGPMSGNGNVNVTGVLHWNGGTISDQFGAGTLNILPGASLDTLSSTVRLDRRLNNHGSLNLNSAVLFSGGTLQTVTNFPTGVINIATSSLSNFIIDNRGTMIYQPFTSSSISGATFENSGTLIVLGNNSLNSNSISFRNGSTIAGSGSLQITSTIRTEGTVNFAHELMLPFGGAFITGSGDLLITGALAGGSIQGTGAVRVLNGGELFVGSISRDLFVEPGGFVRSTQGPVSSATNRGVMEFATSTTTFNGQLNNQSGGVIRFDGGRVNGGSASLFTNAATILAVGGNCFISLPFSNTATLNILAGTMNLNGSVAQLSGETLTAGTWIVGFDAQLNINNGTIASNQADIILNGPFSRFPALNSLADNQGTLSLSLGRSFTAAGSLTNSGVINIDNGGALFVNDALFNSGTFNGLVIQTGSSTLSGNSYIKTLRGGDVFVETSAAARVDYLDAVALNIASQSDLTLGAGSIAHVIDVLNIAPADGTLSAGRLDLLSGRLVIDYTGSSPADAVSQLLATGFNNGDWLGRGITSSSILAGSNFAIGMIESAEVLPTGGTFAGVNVDNTALLLDRTLKGDANLDYTVNISDFAIVAANFNAPTKWSKGDFNYDGVTNIADFALMASNFNQALPTELPRESIPEPALLGVVGIVTSTLKRARR